MLFDLILTLSLAVLVGVVPGYFWARCLSPSDDRAERVAFSTALSLALVPPVALALAVLLGSGVTLPIAVASPLIVLGAGIAAYGRFGPAKASGETIAAVPAPMGALALAPVVAALALVLWFDLQDLDTFWLAAKCVGWPTGTCVQSGAVQKLVPLVALLLLAAGIAHLLAPRQEPRRQSRREPDPSEREPEAGQPRTRSGVLLRRLALPVVLLVVLVRGYSGVVAYDWPFIRGLDHYSHGVMADLIMSRGSSESYLIYPPGFHTMTAVISRLGGLEPLEIFPVLGPALLLLPALACYALARRLWGWECGVAAAFLAGAIMGSSYYYLNDAMYPNLVASQFLMVLAVAALFRLYSTPSARNGLLLALLGSSVVLYHQVSGLYLALLLAAVSLLFLPYLLLRDRRKGIPLLLSLALLGFLAVVYAWDTYDLGQVAASLVGGSETGATSSAVDMAVGTQKVHKLGYLIGAIISQPVTWLGLLGAALAGAALRRRSSLPGVLAWATLLFWVLILYAGSRTPDSGFPQRFGRDLAVPLALLAALALITILRSLTEQRKPLALFAASLAVLVVGSLLGLRALQSLDQASSPTPNLLMTPDIAAAGDWLADHNTGGNIIVSPQGNQVPSRMMLAMGHYSALQSFSENQIEDPRDLPPSGKGPLRDILWTMQHPTGERTERILEKYDVRYVVLYKRMPDRSVTPWWQVFEDLPDDYRKVFENDAALIVEPR